MKLAAALTLLVALAFRLLGGFHPCHLEENTEQMTARVPCHGMTHAAARGDKPAPVRHGDPQAPCCSAGCAASCLLLAAVPASSLVDGTPLAGTIAEGRTLSPHPPYLSPLDHVPLA